MRRSLAGRNLRTLGDGRHYDVDRLCLRVRGDSRLWTVTCEAGGKRKEVVLGSLEEMGIQEARRRAKEAREEFRRSNNTPAKPRLRSVSFQAACGGYLENVGAGWVPRYRRDWLAAMRRHVFPIFGERLVGHVVRANVVEALQPLSPRLARRLCGQVERVLTWAEVMGMRAEGPNPADLKKMALVLPALPRAKRMPSLPYAEVPALMGELRSGHEGDRALAFLILTAARRAEVLGATWAEVDLEKRLWTIPAHRMKSRREHVVPLSGAAMAALERETQSPHHARIFDLGANMLRARLKMRHPEATPHGMRSAFRSWAADHGADFEVAELCLAHVVASALERRYQRSTLLERRRSLMEEWGAYCLSGE